MAASFVPNDAGLLEGLNSAGVKDVLRQVAEKAKTLAEGRAAEFADTGDYEKSFEIEESTAEVRGASRVAYRLTNTSDHSLAVEFGNVHFPEPKHVLSGTLADLEAGG